ncbi:MAG: hypothetical protein NT154_29650 [Verrucomicrobia bacterium]|nr:hypothetical protein [Verrucomicrobiota bacterium]
MKTMTVSILALASIAATAQNLPYYDINGMDYPLNAQFLNNPPAVISVAGLPLPTLTDFEPIMQGAIGTDGSGKIDGVQYARVYLGGAGNHTNNYATFVIDVAGSIRTKGTSPNVKMTLKGYGYDVVSQTDHPDASLSLTFTSTNSPATMSRNQTLLVNSTNYAVTYLDGSTAVFTNGPVTFTNNNPFSMVGGILKGTVKQGKKSTVNAGQPLKINEAASLFTGSWIWTVVNSTNVVQQEAGGSLIVNLLSNITAQVVQPYPGKKLYLAGGVGSTLDPCFGTGTADYNKATYKMKLKGVSSGRGTALDVTGTLGSVIIGYQPTANTAFATGFITNRLPSAIKQISFSGKAFGQKVPLTTGSNPDATFPP